MTKARGELPVFRVSPHKTPNSPQNAGLEAALAEPDVASPIFMVQILQTPHFRGTDSPKTPYFPPNTPEHGFRGCRG